MAHCAAARGGTAQGLATERYHHWEESQAASPRHGAGLRKSYRVHCTDSEVVGAAVDRDSLAIRVIADADELNRRVAEGSAASSAASDALFFHSDELASPSAMQFARCSSEPQEHRALATHMLVVIFAHLSVVQNGLAVCCCRAVQLCSLRAGF